MKNGGKMQTIIGYVGEMEEDDVVRLTIFAEEEDYLVEMNKQGKKLLQELDSEVKAVGEIKRNKDGNSMISITKFEIIDDDYDDEEDVEYDDDDDNDYDDDDDVYEEDPDI